MPASDLGPYGEIDESVPTPSRAEAATMWLSKNMWPCVAGLMLATLTVFWVIGLVAAVFGNDWSTHWTATVLVLSFWVAATIAAVIIQPDETDADESQLRAAFVVFTGYAIVHLLGSTLVEMFT